MTQTIQDVLKKQSKPPVTVTPAQIAAARAKLNARQGCAMCGGTQYLRQDVPQDHPLFGKLTACPDCNTQEGGQAAGGLSSAELALTWDSVIDIPNQNTAAAVAAVRNALALGAGWVYLWGGYGLAKTQILKAAAAECLRAGKHTLYTQTGELMDFLRAAYDSESPDSSALALLAKYAGVAVLLIDEFEKVSETDFVNERRFRLLDKRYEMATRGGEGVTIFAANVPPEKLTDRALADRLRDERFAVIELQGASMRPVARSLV